MMKITYLLFLLILFSGCKKNKLKEINDPEWREKYSQISLNTCKKLEFCFKDSLKHIDLKLQSLAKNEIKPELCMERSKKSKIYLLKVKNVEEAKLAASECYVFFEKLSCEELRENKLNESSACKITRLLQSE